MNSSYGYETDSDLASLSHAWASGAGQTPATFGFQHDGAGRITLTQVNRPDLEWMPTLAEAASYGVPTNLNQTTSVNGVALTWDHNGNLDQHGTTDYQWTLGNRLWRVVKPTSTTEYAYDSTDRRTVVIEDGVMTRTLWSGSDEVGEYDAAGALRRRFIPDGTGAMDARLAMVAADGTVSWFHTNHQGSVIAMSNGSGAAIAVANYAEYGKFGADASGNPLTAPAGGSPFGYTGRQWDAKAGLYNYRARYYDPALGVFLSMDPIGSQDDPNLFMYVGNDPVNKTDPTGMETVSKGGNWVLYPRDPRFPQGISVPRPADQVYFTAGVMNRDNAARTINPGQGSDHAYVYESNIGRGDMASASAAIGRNPVTPEGTNNAATPGGTLNGASSPIGLGTNVMTYSRTGSDGVGVTVNVTVSGEHVFSDGWVMTMPYQNPDGSISVLTYGEGNSPLQSGVMGAATGAYVEGAWARRAQEVKKDIQ